MGRADTTDKAHLLVFACLLALAGIVISGWVYFDAKIERKTDYLNQRIDYAMTDKNAGEGKITKKLVLMPDCPNPSSPAAPSQSPSVAP
jgi:hypothetical protein